MIDIWGPLSISEEKLGAYIEGNLPTSEMKIIESLIQCDNHLKELVDDISIEETNDLSGTVGEEFLTRYNDLTLPEIPTISGEFLKPIQHFSETTSVLESLETEVFMDADLCDCNSVDQLYNCYEDDEMSQDDDSTDYENNDDIDDTNIDDENLSDDLSDM